MKEFISAIEDDAAEQEREDRIAALMAQGKSREEATEEVDKGPYVEFSLDGRVMKAYRPNEGQLTFLLASLGRGQAKEGRFASIINVMLESLDPDDKDYMEGRLLSKDKDKKIHPKTIEGIFEYLTSEWFRPALSGGSETVPDRG